MRKILLKLRCSKASGCCGGGGRKSVKYAILTVEKTGGPYGSVWKLVEATPLKGNYLVLAKKYATTNPAWKGTVVGLKLDKDPDFMAQLNAQVKIPKGCVIAE